MPTAMVVTAAVVSGLLGAGTGYAAANSRTAQGPASTVQQPAPEQVRDGQRDEPVFGEGPHDGFGDDHDGGFR